MKIKLTMISVCARGKRRTFFVNAAYDRDGRARISTATYDRILTEMKLPAGTCVSFGT